MSVSDGAITSVAESGEEIGTCIVGAVATLAGTDETSLPALYETLDVDALNRLCRTGTETLRVSFTYAGYDVVVERTDTVTVSERDD